MTPCIGINIGALTVKVVSLADDHIHFRVMNHRGRPVEVELERGQQERRVAPEVADGVGLAVNLNRAVRLEAAVAEGFEELEQPALTHVLRAERSPARRPRGV